MSKICIIGDRDSVIGFMAVGFSVYEASSSRAAGDILKTLAKDEENAELLQTICSLRIKGNKMGEVLCDEAGN